MKTSAADNFLQGGNILDRRIVGHHSLSTGNIQLRIRDSR